MQAGSWVVLEFICYREELILNLCWVIGEYSSDSVIRFVRWMSAPEVTGLQDHY